MKNENEIRDPIHTFIRFDSDERTIINSEPVQRLRNIHQLAMSYMVYPGATHRRFEHALGVMELAGMVFDSITRSARLSDEVRDKMPELASNDGLRYWRRVLRMAALCHDIGHLPFSHSSEKLLPEGWTHEHLSAELIRSDDMRSLWDRMRPPLMPEHVVKLAIGEKKLKEREEDIEFSDWESLLSEIIVGDNFGVDRIDYLLRDSHHTGAGYGMFPHHRLIDTLRILPRGATHKRPLLGVDFGGIQSAAALLLARHFMFSQVYYHRVRRIYDIHLIDFLKEWLPGGKFPVKAHKILGYTDVEVAAALREAAQRQTKSGHDFARRILRREHFPAIYTCTNDDYSLNHDPGLTIEQALQTKYGDANVRRDSYGNRSEPASINFDVVRNDKIMSSGEIPETLHEIPNLAGETLYVNPHFRDKAKNWIGRNKTSILRV